MLPQSNYAIDPSNAPRILTGDTSEQIDGLLTALEFMLERHLRLEAQIHELRSELGGLTYRHETHIHATTGAVLDIADEAERC